MRKVTLEVFRNERGQWPEPTVENEGTYLCWFGDGTVETMELDVDDLDEYSPRFLWERKWPAPKKRFETFGIDEFAKVK